eukprot:TRINITY_DN3693_c0_g1_i1.p1 TRINITY_DN3693_c0_g1~~TRINITY_DN3693_c0_g1_i1.p1  ORF type:complete len:580 (+),score=100.15 TRINITY_DN3693_c0_g1_i1:63-1802(+)
MKVVLLGLVFVALLCGATANLTLSDVSRQIELKSSLARHVVTFTVTNSDSSVSSVKYTIDDSLVDNIAHISAESDGTALKVGATQDGSYDIQLASPLVSKASVVITVTSVYTNTMQPFPTHISQEEVQLVKYTDNVFFATPYLVDTQTTTITLSSSNVIDTTSYDPFSQKGNTITYGPYTDVAPNTREPLSIHFENNEPFLSATSFTKVVEVSHWGNIAVEEHYEIVHAGAKLEGPFNRLDYQRNPAASVSAVPDFQHNLPKEAVDVYYRDRIGNISTSNVRLDEQAGAVILEMVPRFPLFGGWKTKFYMGYNLPLSKFVSRDTKSSTIVLKIDFTEDLNFDIPKETATFRVILPEGSTNVQIHTPFAAGEPTRSIHKTYLDTTGRPVIEITKNNVVAEDNQEIVVTYEYGTFSLIKKPLVLVVAFFIVFLLAMFLVRFRLSISPDNSAEEKKDKSIRELLVKLKKATTEFASLSKKYKYSSKKKSDQDATQAAIKQIFVDLQSIRSGLEELDDDLGSQVEQIISRAQITQSYLIQLVDVQQTKGSREVYEISKAQSEANLVRAEDDLYALANELCEGL